MPPSNIKQANITERKVTADYYPPNSHVRVVAPDDPYDPFKDWSGTVDWTRNDGGEMVHRVRFGDGNSSWYYADELIDTRSRDTRRTR